jgi:hypothetical protein
MSDTVAGPHHCIGAARAATELVFRSLRALCASSGGTLSLSDLETFQSKFIASFSSGFDLFESIHRNCMDASASTAEMPFARDKLLATLLRACGEHAARHAFSVQVETLGSVWIEQFFDGFAQYVLQHVCASADIRLINAYVDTTVASKTTVSIETLVAQHAIRNVLAECILPFDIPGVPESMTKRITNFINDHVATLRHISGAHLSKITEYQVCSFLTLLPRDNAGLRFKRDGGKQSFLSSDIGETLTAE